MNIVNIGYSLADTLQSVQARCQQLNIPQNQALIFERIFGLKTLPIDENTTVEPLIIKAAEQCLEKANIDKRHIQYLIYTHTAAHACPWGHSVLKVVQDHLGLNHAKSFGTSMNKCASVFTAFDLAQSLFASLNDQDHILIVTGDVSFTEILQYIPGTTITTDGACAILLNKQGKANQFLAYESQTYGEFAGGIWAEEKIQYQFEKVYANYLANAIEQVLAKAQMNINQIRLILPHNVNILSWNKVAKLIAAKPGQIFLDNVSRIAHCFGSDPFINYQDAIAGQRLQKGDYFIMATVGLGASFAAMLFQH